MKFIHPSFGFIAFALVGISHALLLPSHNYTFSLSISLASILIFCIASAITFFALSNSSKVSVKFILGAMLALYVLFACATSWGIIKNVFIV